VPERRIRVKVADRDKRYGEIGRKKRYLLASNVSHRSWIPQEQRAAMRRLELQYLAGQTILIMHGWQAEG